MRVSLLAVALIVSAGCSCRDARVHEAMRFNVEVGNPYSDAESAFARGEICFLAVDSPGFRIPFIDDNFPELRCRAPIRVLSAPTDNGYWTTRWHHLNEVYAGAFNAQMKTLLSESFNAIEEPAGVPILDVAKPALSILDTFKQDPVADAQAAFNAKDYRLLAVDGLIRLVPSSTDLGGTYAATHGIRLIPGTGDASDNYDHQRLCEIASVYATIYNDQMIALAEAKSTLQKDGIQ